MNDLKIFDHEEFGELDILIIEGNPFFPASTCAKALGYSNPHDAISRHCKGGLVKREGVSQTTNQHGTTTAQMIERNYISEGDLYRLIIRSNLPAAEQFESWICEEVLPSIRKHGAYISKQDLERLINSAISQITAAISAQAPITAEAIKPLLPVPPEDEADINALEKNEITFWEAFLAEWRDYRRYLPNKGEADKAFLRLYNDRHPETNISLRTLYRKWNAFCKGNSQSLLDGRGKHGRHRRKIDTFPPDLLLQIDKTIEKMQKEQALNFSEISRLCEARGHKISPTAVKSYYEALTSRGVRTKLKDNNGT